jgi:hypothetical protein
MGDGYSLACIVVSNALVVKSYLATVGVLGLFYGDWRNTTPSQIS